MNFAPAASRAKQLLLVFIALIVCGGTLPCWATAPGVSIQLWVSSETIQSMGSVTFDVQANPLGGVKIASNAAGCGAQVVSGLPSGITASWGKPTVNAWGAVMWPLTLNGSINAVASSTSLDLSVKITATGSGATYTASQAIPLTVTLTPAKLNIAAALTHIPVKQGQAGSDLLTFTSGGSFHGPVNLAVSGLPSGVTASWSSNPVTLSSGTGTSTLKLSPSSSAVTNWFNFTVTASGDGVSVSKPYTIEVEPSVGIQIGLSHQALSVQPSKTTTLSVTATPIDGIKVPSGASGATASVVSGLPSGVTASWSSPTVTSAGAANWTLTLKASSSAPQGSNPITLSIKVTDATTGLLYTSSPNFTLLVALVAAANVKIGATPGATISPTFMGLSHEWGDAQNVMGSSSTGVNKIYRQLLTNLTAYGSDPINLRIGGNSTDVSGEPTSTTVPPLAQVASALGSHFELGVNLGSQNVQLATDQATKYVSQMPKGSVNAIEIGNEPDWYILNGLRPASYTVSDYYNEFYTWKQNILIDNLLPTGIKLMGASWALTNTLTNSQTYQSKYSRDLALISQHFYATNPSANPPLNFLLQGTSSVTGPTQVSAAVALTHSHGMPFRIGELGAISAGGVVDIGEAFGASLWSIDIMFEFAKVGVDGVNWETTTGNYNHPFSFTKTSSKGINTYGLNSVNPLYYGLLFFQAATGNGSKLLPVTLVTPGNMKAWASIDSSGTPKLVLINKDQSLEGTVEVTVPGYNHATMLRLTAPSYTSQSGITFGGQTFDGSHDGTIQGTQTSEEFDGNDGVFDFPMLTTSAALVTFSK